MKAGTDVIIIRGAPASGKSQVAKCLAQFFPKGVKVEVDSLRKMVISVDWTNQSEHISMLQVSARLVYDFLKLDFKPVIVVDTFSGDKIDKFLESLSQFDRSISVKLFALYVTEDVLKKRLELRSGSEFRDFKICKKLNEDVLKIKQASEYQVDTSALSPMQAAEKIRNELARF